jgi:hypothetical protein
LQTSSRRVVWTSYSHPTFMSISAPSRCGSGQHTPSSRPAPALALCETTATRSRERFAQTMHSTGEHGQQPMASSISCLDAGGKDCTTVIHRKRQRRPAQDLRGGERPPHVHRTEPVAQQRRQPQIRPGVGGVRAGLRAQPHLSAPCGLRALGGQLQPLEPLGQPNELLRLEPNGRAPAAGHPRSL